MTLELLFVQYQNVIYNAIKKVGFEGFPNPNTIK